MSAYETLQSELQKLHEQATLGAPERAYLAAMGALVAMHAGTHSCPYLELSPEVHLAIKRYSRRSPCPVLTTIALALQVDL